MDAQEQILNELQLIRKILEFSNRTSIQNAIESIASTAQRRRMWVLMDGERSAEEISLLVGVSERGTRYFIQEGQANGLISMEKRGYPKRTIDLVPSSWKLSAGDEEDKPDQKIEIQKGQVGDDSRG